MIGPGGRTEAIGDEDIAFSDYDLGADDSDCLSHDGDTLSSHELARVNTNRQCLLINNTLDDSVGPYNKRCDLSFFKNSDNCALK